ncbi:MAG: hypothetical protein UY76_C0013G0002 [Candidatus Uhrbacteria bacterium GW2011_GWA2_52_8d]|uniref:Uncharacterized protein n=1 Tax=Candidatus Uhrbacteria bacterium GW2011_GWA2_52_8d TaxID=1618979 RepID=A0A0G2AJX5_9BACT|nr:MAG: hypothetical protein UY76_C0013G0002 [Candidatus Uhrbacteria bacterium GW2011_GWA2_52_8d]
MHLKRRILSQQFSTELPPMPTFTPNTCSRLHTFAVTWKRALDSSEKALQAHTTLFNDETKRALTQAQTALAQARGAYMRASGEKVTVEGKKVIAREAMVMEHILTIASEISFTVESGLVVHINTNLTELPDQLPPGLQELSCHNCPNLTELPDPLPPGLQHLDCSSCPNLTKLPDLLPDTLRFINIRGTPEAKNEEVQERLEAFKKKNPQATVLY